MQLLAPNADPHAYEVRPHDVQALADADLIVRSGGDVDAWLEDAIEGAGSDAPVVDARSTSRRARATTRTGGRTRATRSCRARARARARRPTARGATSQRAAPRGSSTATGAPRMHRRRSRSAAQARHDARRARLLRAPLRPRRDRHRDPVAVHARASRPPATSPTLVRHDPRHRREGDLRRELGGREGRGGDRARDRREVGTALWADTLGPEGSDGATYLDSIAANTRALVEGFDRRADCC